MSIFEIATGLKSNLDVIDGISVSRIPRMNPTPPIIHMWPNEIPAYHRAMAMGLSEVDFTVQLVLDYIDDEKASTAYDYLDPAGDRSVVEAIESDKTLGGACDRLQVVSASGLAASVTADNLERLTAEWLVRIYVDSST